MAPDYLKLIMARCDNCSSFVTAQYVRVFAPHERETVRVCPHCEDRVRDRAEVRPTQSTRQRDTTQPPSTASKKL